MILFFLLLVISLIPIVPAVHAQSTNVTNVTYPGHVSFDLEHGTTDPPLVVEATISYSDAKPGYFLAVGVFDLSSGDPVLGTGGSAGVCDSKYAACVIGLTSSSGLDQVQFSLVGYRMTMSMAIVAVLYDQTRNLIYESESDYVFTVTLTYTLALRVRVPGSVSVSVDGTAQPAGSVWLNLVPGDHVVSVPEIVMVDNVTRVKFQHWSDGVQETSRSVSLHHQTLLTAEYVTQYLLNATTLHGRSMGIGWYDEGSTASYSIQSTTVPMENVLGLLGGRWVFEDWYEQGELITKSSSGTVMMIGAHALIAHWTADYTLPVVFLGGLAMVSLVLILIRRRFLLKIHKARTGGRKRSRGTRRRTRKSIVLRKLKGRKSLSGPSPRLRRKRVGSWQTVDVDKLPV